MLLHTLAAHRLKSSQSNMQRDLGGFDSALMNARKNFWSEMQSRGRSGHGPTLPRIDRLISLAIARRVRPRNIRRQGNMAYIFESSEEIWQRLETNSAFAEAAARQDFAMQLVPWSKEQALTYADFSSRPDQTFPFIWILRELPREQHFDASLQKITRGTISWTHRLCVHASAVSVQSCRKNGGVVEDQQIGRAKQIWKIAEEAIPQARKYTFPRLSGRRLQMQKARSRAIPQRLLRNQFFGQMVIEIRDQHAFDYRDTIDTAA